MSKIQCTITQSTFDFKLPGEPPEPSTEKETIYILGGCNMISGEREILHIEDLIKVQKELETPKEIKRENKLMPRPKPFYDKLMSLLDETFPGNPITKDKQ